MRNLDIGQSMHEDIMKSTKNVNMLSNTLCHQYLGICLCFFSFFCSQECGLETRKLLES